MLKIISLYFITILLLLQTTTHSFVPTCRASSPSNSTKESSNKFPNDCILEKNESSLSSIGKLEELKAKEAKLSKLLESIRKEKLSVLRSKPLRIGVLGFGRFGQFIAKTFVKHGEVVATSRSDYTDIANAMGVKYVSLANLDDFLNEDLDVIVVSVSITSFESTINQLLPHLKAYLDKSVSSIGPLIVDVLSVKEHPRQVLLDLLPSQCDILCTHPMFGPDSGKYGWQGLKFVYERTRIDGVIHKPQSDESTHQLSETELDEDIYASVDDTFVDMKGAVHSIHENNEAHLVGMDRLERFLSIWEEEGCNMIPLSCKEHDQYAANSQFITHLTGRTLDSQVLTPTPVDTQRFKNVLNLVDDTMVGSFDLFYGYQI